MYFLNSLLSSFFRTIGRILAYLLIGMAIILVINEVKAENYEPLSITGFAPDVQYPGQCIDGVCFVDAQVQNLLENPLITNTNLYYGTIENPGSEELHMRGTFWAYGMDALNNPFNLNVTSLKIHMVDLNTFVNDTACNITTSTTTLGFLDNPITTTLYNYDCSWTASSPHEYEMVVFSVVPTPYQLPRQLFYQFENMIFTTDEVDVNDTLEDGFNNVITNQNQNSQNIINNQNQNQTQTNTRLDNIDNTNKSILQKITDLPNTIINGFLNMLKSLFIPSDNFFTDKFNQIRENAESKLGILGYPFILVIDTFEYFLTIEDTGQYIITWPDINVPNFENLPPIIEAGSFDLSSVLEKPSIQMAHDLYFTFVNALLILAFLKLCHNTYVSVFGGEYDNTEYITTSDETWYDNETGESSGMSKHIEKRTKVVRN